MAVLNDCRQFSTIEVEGTLRAPLGADLLRSVEALLSHGQRCILLNLARLSDIDAAGIGELLHAYERIRAAGGVLRISHATGHVRRLLDVTEISRLLEAAPNHSQLAEDVSARIAEAHPENQFSRVTVSISQFPIRLEDRGHSSEGTDK